MDNMILFVRGWWVTGISLVVYFSGLLELPNRMSPYRWVFLLLVFVGSFGIVTGLVMVLIGWLGK